MKKIILIPFLLISLILSGADWYVSPTGSDAATGADITHPWRTWHYAFNHTPASDTCYFRGGTYPPYSTTIGAELNSPTNQGTHSHPTCFFAYPVDWISGNYPVMDCVTLTKSSNRWGIQIYDADNYYFKGLTVKNVRQPSAADASYGWIIHNWSQVTGFTSNNIRFENCVSHHIGGTGFLCQAVDSIYFINCDTHHVCDSLYPSSGDPGGLGTGFGVYNTPYGNESQSYVYFHGCRAWQCSDQGFSFFYNGTAISDSCWSINNGNMPFEGNELTKGSGFKLWYYNASTKNASIVQVILRNCIAAYNEFIGINWTDINNASHPEIRAHIYNNFCYHNGLDAGKYPVGGWGFGIEDDGHETDTIGRWDHWYWNNISYDNLGFAPYSGNNGDVLHGVFHEATNKFDVSGTTISDADFVSLDTTGLCGARQADGSLPVTTFGHLASTSECINAGTNVGLPYKGAAPDIGWFEFDFPVEPAVPQVNTAAPVVTSPTTVTVGGNTITDGGSVILTKGVYWATHSNPDATDNVIACGSGSANYTTPITGLVSGVTYHVKAYVTNAVGAGYGADESWVMPPDAPVVTGGPVGTGGKIIKHLGKIMIVP